MKKITEMSKSEIKKIIDLDGDRVKIESDRVCDYPVGTELIVPDSKDGYQLPFQLYVISPNSLYARFEEDNDDELWDGTIKYAIYYKLLGERIEQRSKELGDVTLEDQSYDYEGYSTTYSFLIECTTISEGIQKCCKLMDEIFIPLNQAADKVENFLRREIGLNN